MPRMVVSFLSSNQILRLSPIILVVIIFHIRIPHPDPSAHHPGLILAHASNDEEIRRAIHDAETLEDLERIQKAGY